MNFDSLIPRVLETVIAEATDVGVTPFLYEDDDYMIGGRAAVDGDIVYGCGESRLLNGGGTVYALWVECVNDEPPPSAPDIEKLRVELEALFDNHIKQKYNS